MASIVSDAQKDPMPRDGFFGGFTVVRDKLRYKTPKVHEILPFWITNSISCSNEIETGMKIKHIEHINGKLLKNLRAMRIRRLFPVQSAVIPYVLDCYSKRNEQRQLRDICISAPTGSGKTLSYALPIIQLLFPCKSKIIRAVIILPVRDLAKQVSETIKRLIVDMPLRVILLTGEESFSVEQNDIFFKCDGKTRLPDIIVCTPGRLVDHIYNTPDFCLEHVRFLVIDEADRVIVEEKQDWYNVFESAVYGGITQQEDAAGIKPDTPKRSFPMPTIESQCSPTEFTLQKILLSATLTHDPEPLKRFRLNFPRLFLSSSNQPPSMNAIASPNAAKIEDQIAAPIEESLGATKPLETVVAGGDGGVGVFSTPSGLREFFVEVIEKHKPLILAHLVKKLGHSKILCFTNSRETTKRLAFVVSQFDGVKAEALNAGMPLAKRTRLLNSFRDGCIQILVCTDAVARGIDIDDVSCVISYEAPQSVKTYVHRIGRTARAGKAGEAFTLLLHNQIRYFKSSLKSVGKHAKNLVIHASKLRVYNADYDKALSLLEKEFQIKATDAFGVVRGDNVANRRPRARKTVCRGDEMPKTKPKQSTEAMDVT